jgi:hypothetical protein
MVLASLGNADQLGRNPEFVDERHNLDPAGHYARPDVTRLDVSRRRQTLASFSE